MDKSEPLEKLVKYLGENIYSKMSKKDVDAIFKGSLEGDLMKAIKDYYLSQRGIDFADTWKRHSEAMQYKEGVIWKLKTGNEMTMSDRMGYGQGRYQGD